MTKSEFHAKIAELGVARETLYYLTWSMNSSRDMFPAYPTMRRVAEEGGTSLGSAQHRVATLRRLGLVHEVNGEHTGIRLTNEGYNMANVLFPPILVGGTFDVKNSVDV